jgi:hypothetical protein
MELDLFNAEAALAAVTKERDEVKAAFGLMAGGVGLTLGQEAARWVERAGAAEAALAAAVERAERAEKGWRCFHCTEFFTTEQAAREHFGADMEDEGPGCVDQLRTDEVERLREVRVAREEWAKARREVEDADEKLGLLATYESEIGRYFGNVGGVRASTPHQAWLRFEAEQGRAEAAESRAEVLAGALRVIAEGPCMDFHENGGILCSQDVPSLPVLWCWTCFARRALAPPAAAPGVKK